MSNLITKTRIGLDLSFNSTGMCIIRPFGKPIWYQICPSETNHSKSVFFETYQRHYDSNGFSDDELNKIRDGESLAKKIKELIRRYVSQDEEVEIRIEAPINTAFMKSARFHNQNDLVALNKIVTLYMMHMKGATIKMITANQNKKAFTGKGNGKKEKMIETFFRDHFPHFDNNGKIDDLIDAYALAFCNF